MVFPNRICTASMRLSSNGCGPYSNSHYCSSPSNKPCTSCAARNHEWVTVVECINAFGWSLRPMIIFSGKAIYLSVEDISQDDGRFGEPLFLKRERQYVPGSCLALRLTMQRMNHINLPLSSNYLIFYMTSSCIDYCIDQLIMLWTPNPKGRQGGPRTFIYYGSAFITVN
jgi:hypothetical protein